ncbi:MAG: hypothetical protein WDZ93_02880 [Candidatus Paceibacterota bacterium]
MGSNIQEQLAIAKRLRRPQPEGRILNHTHVREEREPWDSIANQLRSLRRLNGSDDA